MINTPLATVEELAAFLREDIPEGDLSATLMLDVASGMVRSYLRSQVSEVASDTILLDPIEGSSVLLPEYPVNNVSLVEIVDPFTNAWVTLTPDQYDVSLHTGIIKAISGNGITYPSRSATWRVTYDHGYSEVPPTIKGVVLGVAGRSYVKPVGILSESVGQRSTSYDPVPGGLTPLEEMALDYFYTPRFA